MLTDVYCRECEEVVKLCGWPGQLQSYLRCGCMSVGVNQQWSSYWRLKEDKEASQ